MWVDVNRPVHGTIEAALEPNEFTPHVRLPPSMGHHLRNKTNRRHNREKTCPFGTKNLRRVAATGHAKELVEPIKRPVPTESVDQTLCPTHDEENR